MYRIFEYMIRSAEDHTLPASIIGLSRLLEKTRGGPTNGGCVQARWIAVRTTELI